MGSNFIDTVVVIGFSALVAGTMKIGTQKRRHLLFLLGLVAAAMGFLFYLETIQPVMGVILIAAYIALVFFLWRSRHARAEATEAMEVEHLAEAQHEDHIVWYGSAHLAALAGFTQVALYSGKELAALYELPLEFLGATVFALATSLPEFVISLHSARRKAYGLLLGNALGAALQQGFFTMGVLAIFARTPIHLHEVSGLIWYMAVGFAILGISIWQQTIHRATGAAMVGLGILFFVQQAIQQLG
jgi:Ca2+/Na+ antiporter